MSSSMNVPRGTLTKLDSWIFVQLSEPDFLGGVLEGLRYSDQRGKRKPDPDVPPSFLGLEEGRPGMREREVGMRGEVWGDQ
jgi:hypothetical protein